MNATKYLNTCKFVWLKPVSKKQFEIAYYDLVEEQFKLVTAKRVNPKSLEINKMSKDVYVINSVYTHLLKIMELKKVASDANDLF